MKSVEITLDRHFKKGEIDRRIYGSLAEHMGRVVYTGIYDPDSIHADEDGFRKDVMDAVREAGITTVRYPGGNFVSTFCWEDGVGPKEKRPKRLDLAWKALETNQFGTDEFIRWTKKTGTEPLMAVNLGTRGISDAVNYLEYCNMPGGTKYSNMRVENGIEKPYGIKLWCLGNEMDGEWQIGHKEAHEYGRLAAETSKAMKVVDSSIETILCGSSLNTMKTYPEWEAQVLDDAFEYVDYISLHQYFGGQEKGTEKFISQADDMSDYIRTVNSVCKYIKAKKRSKHDVLISMDEWGVWTCNSSETVREANEKMWQTAPAISEMIYSFEDTLLFAGMLMSIIKNADIVKLACQSLIANISSMIMTEKGGEIWYQPIYYPFKYMARYARGSVLELGYEEKSEILDCVAVHNYIEKEIVLFLINRSCNEDIDIKVNLQGYETDKIVEHVLMHDADIKATNREVHDRVKPDTTDETKFENGTLTGRISHLSWNMIRVSLKG